jgi:hypothetical protein
MRDAGVGDAPHCGVSSHDGGGSVQGVMQHEPCMI